MRDLMDFRERVDEAVVGEPLTMGEVRHRARRRRSRRWAGRAGVAGVLALVGVVAFTAGRGGDGVIDRGVLVASADDLVVLAGQGSPTGSTATGDITDLLRGVDEVVEVERIELVDVGPATLLDLRDLVFAVDLAPVDGAPAPAVGGTTRVVERVWDGRASSTSFIEPGMRVVALLDAVDPTTTDVPAGVTHSLAGLLSVTDDGQMRFLVHDASLPSVLDEARYASSFDGTDLELLVAWVAELAEHPDGGPITRAYRPAQIPVEPRWEDLAPDERAVEPGAAPPEVLAELHPYRVLVEASAAATAGDDRSVWITSELGVHHVAAMIDSIGDVWLGSESLLAAGVRAADGSVVQAGVPLPPAPAAVPGAAPTLLVTVRPEGDRFRIDAEWIDATAAQAVLERWADHSVNAPSPEPR